MELALNDGTTPVPVRQIATRVDTVVHAFNVLAGERRQRVLFRYDESTHLTVAYSMRVDGALDKAVSYHSGGASSVVPPAAAKAGYLREVKFWSEYVRGKSAAPAPVPAPPGVSPAAAPPVPTPDDAATRQ